MADAYDGSAVPVVVYGRKALCFPANEDTKTIFHFMAPGKQAVVSGYPKLYFKMKFLTTAALSSNITCQVGMKLCEVGAVWSSTITNLTRYINSSVFSSTSAYQPYNISLDLTSAFSSLTLTRNIDFDIAFSRLGTEANDAFSGDLIVLLTKTWWCPRASAAETNVFATLPV